MKKVSALALLVALVSASNSFAKDEVKYPAKQYQIPAQQYQKHGTKTNQNPVVAAKSQSKKVDGDVKNDIKTDVKKQKDENKTAENSQQKEAKTNKKNAVKLEKNSDQNVKQDVALEPKTSWSDNVWNKLKLHGKKPAGKTEGHYVGVDVLGTRSGFYQRVENTNGDISRYSTSRHISYGLGFSYKYAFNFDKFFVAPGLILEQNSFSGDQNNDHNNAERLRINNRYGAKVDFGYDFNERVSPYLSLGYAGISYKTSDQGTASDNVTLVQSYKNGFGSSVFCGLGVKINLIDNLYLNAEYNRQSFIATTRTDQQYSDYVLRTTIPTKLDIVKIGLAYNF